MRPWLDILQPLTSVISAHNSQPFLLEVEGSHFRIKVNSQRLLPVADPHHRDLEMSLGALLECLKIIFAHQNLAMMDLHIYQNWLQTMKIADFSVETSPQTESLSLQVLQARFSYRGPFRAKDFNEKQEATEALLQQHGFYFSSETSVKNRFAKLYDDVNFNTLRKPNYLAELYSWMRLSASHQNWERDGLNAESINLSLPEAWGAALIMRPAVFSILASLGIVKALISEAPQIKSAHVIVAITAPAGTDAISQGRIFLRKWAELAQANIFGAPLSLLTEEEPSRLRIREWLKIPKDLEIVNVLRCGYLNPNYKRYAPARLPIEEMVKVISSSV